MRFLYKDSSLVSIDKIKETSDALSSRIETLKKCSECSEYTHFEDFLHFSRDKSDSEIAKKITKEKGGKLKCIFVVGIGGANLGAQAVTMALRYSVPTNSPKLLFFDTPDPLFLKHVKENINEFESKEEFILLVISKSGETLETIANAKILTELLENKFSLIEDRIIILSKHGSPLWGAYSEGVEKIPLKEKIPDRYSVFSIIGLLPLALGGMDIDRFLSGGNDALLDCLSLKFDENYATISASVINFHYVNSSIHTRDFFFFIPELEYLGKWSRQLIAESLGKDGKGVTPTVSIGTTDLHSMAQLYLNGPKDKFTSFINIEEIPKFPIKESKLINGLDILKDKSISDLASSIYKSYVDSCHAHDIPFSQMLLKDLSEHSLGMYMQYLMIETLLLAELLHVDPFNQPAVEEYKSNAIKILNS